jgi:(p)ppGpp synthase/HD superfamily hydrolase
MKNDSGRPLALDARTFAAEQHTLAGVRYGDNPFEYHLDAVATILLAFGHDEYGVIAAAYLHDVVEDTPVTIQEVGQMYGFIIRDLVDAVTDMKVDANGVSLGNRRKRQSLTHAKLRAIAAKRVDGNVVVNLKLADRIANIEESLRTANMEKLGMYFTEHSLFVAEVSPAGGDPLMWSRLEMLIASIPAFKEQQALDNALRF